MSFGNQAYGQERAILSRGKDPDSLVILNTTAMLATMPRTARWRGLFDRLCDTCLALLGTPYRFIQFEPAERGGEDTLSKDQE